MRLNYADVYCVLQKTQKKNKGPTNHTRTAIPVPKKNTNICVFLFFIFCFIFLFFCFLFIFIFFVLFYFFNFLFFLFLFLFYFIYLFFFYVVFSRNILKKGETSETFKKIKEKQINKELKHMCFKREHKYIYIFKTYFVCKYIHVQIFFRSMSGLTNLVPGPSDP